MDVASITLKLQRVAERCNLECLIYGCSAFLITSLTYVAYRFFFLNKPQKLENQRQRRDKSKNKKKKESTVLDDVISIKGKEPVPEKKKTANPNVKTAAIKLTESVHVGKVKTEPQVSTSENEDGGPWMETCTQAQKKMKEITHPNNNVRHGDDFVHKNLKNVAAPPVIIQKVSKTSGKPKEQLQPVKNQAKSTKSNDQPKEQGVKSSKKSDVANAEERNHQTKSTVTLDSHNHIPSPESATNAESGWIEAPASKKKRRPRKE